MNKTLALSALVALVVSLGVYMAFPKTVQNVVQQLGAIPGSDLNENYSTGGIQYAARSVGLFASSTTLCTIKNPFATSTLVSAELNVFSQPLGSVVFDLSTTTVALNGGNGSSTPQFASSITLPTGQSYIPWVPLASTTQVANVKQTWGFVTDPGTLASGVSPLGLGVGQQFVLKPGEALSWRIATSVTSGATFASFPTGRCNATFRKLGN